MLEPRLLIKKENGRVARPSDRCARRVASLIRARC